MEEENSLHLEWMNIDYAIRKDKSIIIATNTIDEKALCERWERYRLSVMFIKTKISASVWGSIDQHDKVKALLKAIDEQFKTLDKTLVSTLIMISSLRLTNVRGVRVNKGHCSSAENSWGWVVWIFLCALHTEQSTTIWTLQNL